MKLARIILPDRDNIGASLFLEHAQLKGMLLELWGGYTQLNGMGCHKSPTGVERREPVVVYEIAMERGDVIKLREVAKTLCKDARQECVMIVTPCGDVEFVKAA